MEDSKDKVQENLLANGVDLISYLTRFEWDMAKYPIKQPLKNISEALAKQVTQIEADLKTRSAAYNNIKGNLQNLEKKTVPLAWATCLESSLHCSRTVLEEAQSPLQHSCNKNK